MSRRQQDSATLAKQDQQAGTGDAFPAFLKKKGAKGGKKGVVTAKKSGGLSKFPIAGIGKR